MDYAITPPPGLDDASMAAMRRPVILCLSRGGSRVAETLAKAVTGDVHGLASRCLDAPFHFEDTIAHIAGLFVAGRPVIGLCAAAILICAVAPHLGQKQHDAPVLAIADDGSSIVPLLGLHNGALILGHGRRLAAALAVTTASNLGDGVCSTRHLPDSGLPIRKMQLRQWLVCWLAAVPQLILTSIIRL